MDQRPMPYFDSGVLVKLYIREPNSPRAIGLVRDVPGLLFNPLHELELVNTFHVLAGRALITLVQRTAADHHLAADLAAGLLCRHVPDWQELFALALELSRQYTGTTLARSLDILHVAAAISCRATRLITADKRQAELARQAGLDCLLVD